MTKRIMMAVFCVGLAVACSNAQTAQNDPSGKMTLMSYNVMHCEGSDKKINIARTAEVIKREAPRFAGLQELDYKAAKRSGGVDQPAELERLTGMHATFAQALPFQGGGYGVAVLSREKPISVFKKPLPGREPRVLLLCEFEDCWFGTTHLSLQETNRLASVEIIRKAVAERASTKPVYLTGDWNARPTSKPLNAMRSFMTILSDTTGRTYHGFNWSVGPDGKTGTAPAGEFCIDYIAVDAAASTKLTVLDSHVIPDVTTSDHSPVVATVAAAAKKRPLLVGVTEQWLGGQEGRAKRPFAGIGEEYAEAIRRGGNIPVVICRTADTSHLAQVLAPLDILILSGGADVEPKRYGAEPSPNLGKVQLDRDAFDFAVLEAALARKLPVLGVCRGVQVINVYFGGTLWQDLPSEFPVKGTRHRCETVSERCHAISIEPDSRLAATIGVTNIIVNSMHHQAAKHLAPGFRIVARAPDGVIEAIEHTSLPVVGVQFHPEGLVKYANDEYFTRLFGNLPTFIGFKPHQ